VSELLGTMERERVLALSCVMLCAECKKDGTCSFEC
jgi:hypothetical protein